MGFEAEPREALTSFLNIPGIGQIRLDFLITYESDAFYIRCLDFGLMSCGETLEECKENIKEAAKIHLEDFPEGQSIFKPPPLEYWQMFHELRYQMEREGRNETKRRHALAHC